MMGRRTYERRSRAQNTEEIVKIRDRFRGEVSDIPANAINPENQVELVNQVCYEEYCQSRGAIVCDVNVGKYLGNLPGVFWGVFTQDYTTLTSTDGYYSFTSADVGKLICFSRAYGIPDGLTSLVVEITDFISSTQVTVNVAQTFVTATSGLVRPYLRCLWWNDFNQVFIAHVGNVLYAGTTGAGSTWTAINLVGDTAIGDSISYMQDLDQYVIVICDGVWQIDVKNGLYFKANIEALTNNMVADPPVKEGYNRKYLVTQSRMTGDAPIYGDRTSLTLQHESGSNILEDATDFIETGSKTATGMQYDTLTVIPNLNAFMAKNDVYSIFYSVEAAGILAGTNNGVYCSQDGGATWKIQNTGFPSGVYVNRFAEIVSASMLFAATNSGIYMSSNGGDTWSSYVLDGINITSLVIYNNTVYAGTTGNGVYSSDEGSSYQTWTHCNTGLPNTTSGISTSTINDIAVSGTQVVASVQGSGVYALNNGVINMQLNGIAYGTFGTGPGIYVAVGTNGTIITSSDLVNWSNQVSGAADDELKSIVYADGKFVVVGGPRLRGATNYIYTSLDGINWVKIGAGFNGTLWSICYAGGYYIAAGNRPVTSPNVMACILKSSDAITWTKIDISALTGIGAALFFVADLGVRTIAVGQNATNTGGAVVYSYDKLDWQLATQVVPILNSLWGIAVGMVSGVWIYVAVGSNGSIYTSQLSPSLWTLQTSGVYSDFKSVVFADSEFVAVSSTGQIVTSPDGINWTLQTSGTIASLASIVYQNSKFLAVGAIGTILSSTDANTWTASNNANNWSTHKVSCNLNGTTTAKLLLQSLTYGIGFDYQVEIKTASLTYGKDCTVEWISNPNILTITINSNNSGASLYSTAQNIVDSSKNPTGTPWGILSVVVDGSYSIAMAKTTVDLLPNYSGNVGNINNGLTSGVAPGSLCFVGNNLFAGMANGGVYKFANLIGSGASWTADNTNLPSGVSVSRLVYNPNSTGVRSQCLFALTNMGVYFTNPSTVAWSALSTGISSNSGIAQVVSNDMTFYNNNLFLAASIITIAGGVYKCTDGLTWAIASVGMFGTYLCLKLATKDSLGNETETLIQFAWVPPPALNNIITLIQTTLQTAIQAVFPTATVTVDGNTLIFAMRDNSVEYFAIAADADMPAGDILPDENGPGYLYLDIGGNGYLNGQDGSPGVDLESNAWLKYKKIAGIQGAPDQITHYSIYGTEDLTYPDNTSLPSEIVGNDPVAFAWRNDIPVMKAFKGTIQSTDGCGYVTSPIVTPYKYNYILWLTGGTANGEGQYQKRDVGRKVSVVYTKDGGTTYKIISAYITYVENETKAYLANNDLAASLDIGTLEQCYAVVDSRYLTVCTAGALGEDFIITISKVFDTNTSSGTIIPMSVLPEFYIGQQLFLSNGNISVVRETGVGTGPLILYLVSDSGTTSCAATVPINYGTDYTIYQDDATDDDVSPRIGTNGLKTRFMRSIPDSQGEVLPYIGVIAPGFLVVGNGQNYYWSDLGNVWNGGNYNPDHQTDVINGIITAISKHADVLAIWTNYKVSQIQTNLAIDYTDSDNGAIVRTLPQAQEVESLRGVNSMACICNFQNAVSIVYLNDGSMRTFNGYTFGNDLLINKLKYKIKALYNVTVDFFKDYGVLLRAASTPDLLYNDSFYYIDTGFNESVGCGKFEDLPMGEQGIHFGIAFDNVYMFIAIPVFKVGDLNDRQFPGFFANFYTSGMTITPYLSGISFDGQKDDYWGNTGCGDPFYDITSLQITGDDTGTKQHFYIEDMEGHIYLSPYLESDTSYLNRLIVSASAYNDIGALVTTASQVTNNDDITYDTKIRGHRIRHKYVFSCAGWIMNGLTNYYKSADKRTATNSGDIESAIQAIIGAPAFGISRYPNLINIADGKKLVGTDSSGALKTFSFGRDTGADGVFNSAFYNAAPNSGIGILGYFTPGVMPTDWPLSTAYIFTLSFWYKLQAGSIGDVITGLPPYTLDRLGTPCGHQRISLDATASKIIFYGDGADPLPFDIPALGWHFITIQCYVIDGEPCYGQISIDNGSWISDWTSPANYLRGLFMSNIMICGSCSHRIEDLRIYPSLLDANALSYYHNDIVSGGTRLLPLA